VALAEGNVLALRTELNQRLGKTDRAELVAALRPGTGSTDATVRAAAYEALGRVLEGDAPGLESLLRAGLVDPDGRVRRRVVLAAATARGVTLGPLLEPLASDPDPQVQRVVREALRHARPAETPVAVTGTDR
jgi:HEAT repeat protein